MKKFIFLIPLLAFGATTAFVVHIRALPFESILLTSPAGELLQAKIGSGLSVSYNRGAATLFSTANFSPSVTTTVIQTGNEVIQKPDSRFCLVFRAIVMAESIDYQVVDNKINFFTPLQRGEVVQVICF